MDKQMKQLSSLSEKREALRDSYLLLISYKHVDPIAYEGIEQIWSRIWTAPQDLHMLYKKYAQVEKKQYKQLKFTDLSLLFHMGGAGPRVRCWQHQSVRGVAVRRRRRLSASRLA